MTIDPLSPYRPWLAAIAALPCEWEFHGRMIRTKHDLCCPMQEQTKEMDYFCYCAETMRAFPGVNPSVIADTADNKTTCNPALRAALLAACRLEER